MMNAILKMQNSLQAYQWGSRTAIAQLMGRSFPTQQPEAELWLGAHPKSSSKVWLDGQWQAMDSWIDQDPDQILGSEVADRFDGKLPYLFKILAAAQPLSIQAHPNRPQALSGFKKENDLKIPMDAGHRNYKDPYHKPECLCALTPFWILCGFRPEKDILAYLKDLLPRNHRDPIAALEKGGLKAFFKNLMAMPADVASPLVSTVIEKASSTPTSNAIHQWMVRLYSQFPGDVGVLAPCYLNLVQLQPGEAVALSSGHLHAYLDGLGIELMANSDNVLRGGLTNKHVDVPELLDIVRFSAISPQILRASQGNNLVKYYPSQAEEFLLHVITTTPHGRYASPNRTRGPEILLCTKGKAKVAWHNGTKTETIVPGQSLFVTAGVDQYTVEGQAVLYKAGVNHNKL